MSLSIEGKNMNRYIKANRVIENLIKEGYKRFILYPFGEQGMMIKRILNERYGIEEEYIVDNKLVELSKNDRIISLDKLKDIDISDIKILLTSDNEEIYSEIRFAIMQYVGLDKVVDVFSYSMYFDKQVYYDISDYSTSLPRVAALEMTAREIYNNGIEGAIAECGVYRGWFSNYMSRFMPDRKLYLYDTFSGFDKRDIDDEEDKRSDQFRRIINFSDTNIEIVLDNIAFKKNAIIRKGYFPETIQETEKKEHFAFVSLDMDLYKPIMAGLEFFWPRLSYGGAIFVHDFACLELGGRIKLW